MKTQITLNLTAANGGVDGEAIPAEAIAIFDPKNGQVNSDGDLINGDRVKGSIVNGILLDATGVEGVWLEPGQYWASVIALGSRITRYVEVPESDVPILLTSLFELEAVPGWRLTEAVVAEVEQARDEAVAAAEGAGADPEHIAQVVNDVLLSGEVELPPGPEGPEGPEGPRGPAGLDGNDGPDGAEGPRGLQGIQGEPGADGSDGAPGRKGDPGADGNDGPQGPPGLDGSDGEQGLQGPPGTPGKDGTDGAQGIQGERGLQGLTGPDGPAGADGLSAYEIAVAEGFVGTEAAFLDSLVGPEGPQGEQGIRGPEGPKGNDGLEGPQGLRGLQGIQGEEGPQGPEGPEGDKGDTGATPPKADLVGALQAPVIVAHRGGGKSVYPEQGLRGMIAAAEDGFLPEFDIQFLGDSTPVLCHDTTVDRTMTGATGNVSNLTREQWSKARLKPVYKGGRDDRPLLFEEALDYLGGRTVLVPEIKRDATMAQVDIVIDLVLERGLERAVLMQSFDYDACLRIAAAGMEVVYLHGTGPSVSWQTMLDAGIRYWGPNRNNATAAEMNEAAAAGIRVVPYTAEEPWHVKDLPASVFGYFSNDPWGNSGRFGSYGTPRWEVGEAWPARRNTDEDGNKVPSNWSGPSIRGGQLHVPQPTRLSSISLEHLTGGFVQSPVRLEATFRFGPSASSASANAGFHLIRNDQDDSRLFADKAVPGQQGYTIGIRRNGTLDAWQYVDGASASKVGSNAGGSLGLIANETESVTLVVELVGTKLTAKCLTNGATFEADVSVTGSFRPYLRINSTEALFESVSVARL